MAQQAPLNGRELVAEDVKFTYDRFLTEPGNANRYLLDAVDRIEVVDRYTVKFLLKEPYVWFLSGMAYPTSMWIVAPEVVQQLGDLKKAEGAIGTGPFILERYEPSVKTIFKRNPDYYRHGQPYADGVEWIVVPDESTGLAMYRTGQLDCGPGINWAVRQQDLEACRKLVFDIQRYVAEQQYYVYLNSNTITASWQPYVKNFAPNHSFDYGNRAAALWLER